MDFAKMSEQTLGKQLNWEVSDLCFLMGQESKNFNVNDKPKSFQEARHHPDPIERAKWRTSIRKEFQDMIKRGVWRNKKKSDIPSNRRLVGCKWVFKKKRDGRYRARLVAQGFTQVAGVDFTDLYAPVILDATFQSGQ